MRRFTVYISALVAVDLALYSAGGLLGSAAIAVTGRYGDRAGRLPVAGTTCLMLGGGVAILTLPLGTAAFAGMLVAIAPVMSVIYAVGYPLGSDGADRAG